MSTRHTLGLAVAAIALLSTLAACGTGDDGGPDDGAVAVAVPTATASDSAQETAGPPEFMMPSTCAGILPQSRLDDFARQGLVLLGGPGGRYGNEYLLDETPEEEAGGITCIWGFDDTEISSVTVSVAPLGLETRASVVTSLTDQGLNEEAVPAGLRYGIQGDQDHTPAITNVLREDSWISVIESVGGEAFYREALEIAADASTAVYTAGHN